jgi:hypothetical protein
MCLFIDIEPLGTGPTRAGRRTTSPPLPAGTLRVTAHGGRLTISEDGGCGCSLLAEDADWEDPVWRLRPDVCDSVARTVLALGERLPGGFAVQALWAGDAAPSEVDLSATELAQRVRSNALANFTRYVVHPAPAS